MRSGARQFELGSAPLAAVRTAIRATLSAATSIRLGASVLPTISAASFVGMASRLVACSVRTVTRTFAAVLAGAVVTAVRVAASGLTVIPACAAVLVALVPTAARAAAAVPRAICRAATVRGPTRAIAAVLAALRVPAFARAAPGLAVSGLALFALAASPTPAQAQALLAADLSFRPTFLWRGLTRISSPSLQPSVSLGFQRESWMLTAGTWTALEPFGPAETERSLVGRGGGLAGETDVWLQYDRRVRFFATFDLALGWTAYRFHGDPLGGGVGEDWNTSELYLRLKASELREVLLSIGLPAEMPVAVDLSTWADLGPVGGAYSELALEAELPVLFTGEPFGAAIVRAASGLSWGQSIEAPGDIGYYDGSGITHLDFSLAATPVVRLGGMPLTLYLAGHLQVGIDERTILRGTGPDDRDRVIPWLDLTASVLLPLGGRADTSGSAR